jgi:CheY-like chemotaxis protein
MNAKPINILYADDDVDDCNFFSEALKSLPMNTSVTTVKDGEELMDYLSENALHLPHVLFLDINMPRKNGFECLTEIKQSEKLKDLPVVMFSTSSSKEKINILFKSGASVYVHKPDNFVQLIQVINHALPLAVENIFSNGKLKYILNA